MSHAVLFEDVYPTKPRPGPVSGQAVTVGVERVVLYAGGAERILVVNRGSATVWVGGADVAISDGIPVEPTEALGFDTLGREMWAVSSTAAQAIYVLAAD